MINKIITASLLATFLMGSVSFAETVTPTPTSTPKASAVTACVKTANDAYKTALSTEDAAHVAAIKEANDAYKSANDAYKTTLSTANTAYAAAIKSADNAYKSAIVAANSLTDKKAKKDALTAARKALQDAKKSANQDLKTAKDGTMAAARKAMQDAKKSADKDLKTAKSTSRTRNMSDKTTCRTLGK